jgi:predicted protein tyrosine phosphatase
MDLRHGAFNLAKDPRVWKRLTVGPVDFGWLCDPLAAVVIDADDLHLLMWAWCKPVTQELLLWADLIFVIENVHRKKLSAKFGAHLNRQPVICLDIFDDYEYKEPALVELLKKRVIPHL